MPKPQESNNHPSGTTNGMDEVTEDGLYKTPGQYEHDGVTFPGILSPLLFPWLRDNFTFRHDDIFIAAYPKTGSTWLLMIIYLMFHKEEIHQEELSVDISRISHFLEGMTRPGGAPKFHLVDNLSSPRILRSHLPIKFVQNALNRCFPKIVVLVRNPKDTLVSMFNFYRMFLYLGQFKGTWNDFFPLIFKERTIYGSWFDHVLGWSNVKNHPRVLFLSYEDMKADHRGCVNELAKFFNTSLTEWEVEKIIEMTTFERMKHSPKTNMEKVDVFDTSVSHFFRKGEVGDWKNYFTVAQNEWFDKTYETTMASSDVLVKFEL